MYVSSEDYFLVQNTKKKLTWGGEKTIHFELYSDGHFFAKEDYPLDQLKVSMEVCVTLQTTKSLDALLHERKTRHLSCGTIMSINVCIYTYIYGGGSLCVVGGRRNHLQHLWSGARVSRYSFVYFGVKTTQRAVPTKTYKTGREDEGRGHFRSETPKQWVINSSQRHRAGQSALRHGSRTVRGRYGIKNEDTEQWRRWPDESASLVAV